MTRELSKAIMKRSNLLTNDEEVAEMFNKYFCNITKNLLLPQDPSNKELSAVTLMLY